MNDTTLAERVQRSAELLRARAGGPFPRIAVLLGSGLDPLAHEVEAPLDVPYAELPAFPLPGVAGHAGCVRLGRIGGRAVALLRGRKHAYETGDAGAMKGPVRTLAALGCRVLVQTNAAGSLDASMRPGELMLLRDHLNLVQCSPLFHDDGASRFVDMSQAYDPGLQATARAAALREGIVLHEGVYAWQMGPQFETPAEIRMLQLLGAQAVGRSTVPETILARHAGLRVLAVSLLTNMGCGIEPGALSHAQTLACAEASADKVRRLLRALLHDLTLDDEEAPA